MTAETGSAHRRLRSTTRARPAAVWSLVGLYLAASGMGTWLSTQVHAEHAPVGVSVLAWLADDIFGLLWMAAFALVGAVIVSRRPGQPVGQLMLVIAAVLSSLAVGRNYAAYAIGGSPSDPPTSGVLAGWISVWSFVLFVVLGLALLPLVYPDGRLLSRRWRPVVWMAVAVVLLSGLGAIVSDRLSISMHPAGAEPVLIFDIANPLKVGWAARVAGGIPEPATAAAALLFLLAFASVIVRFRRSRGVERQQMKCLVFTPIVLILFILAGIAAGALIDGLPGSDVPLQQLLFVAYPVAVGLAVLRYRLYDIDRIISRTVAYGLVVAVLGAVYVAGVVGLGTAVSAVTGQEGSDLVVAASVLAVVALFGPVRSRVQRAVERRFNRSGYEARQAVDVFAQELRDEVDLEAIQRSLVTTTAATVQPTSVSVWLTRHKEEQGP